MSEAPLDVAPADLTEDHARFAHDRFVLRRQLFTFVHTNIHVYDPDGELVLYTRKKGLRLKEDLRLYSDQSRAKELLRITTRQVIDFSAGYQVHDSILDEPVGTLKRKGFKSMLRDEWAITDAEDRPIGTIIEDSTFKAVLRRFVDAAAFLMPQRYHVEIDGRRAVTLKQNFNPFVQKLDVRFEEGSESLDRRLGLAAAVLLLAIEGRQS